MKIAITGSQGVGKTTLIKELQKIDSLKHFNFIQESARAVIGKYPEFAKADQLRGKAKEEFQSLLIENQCRQEYIFDSFISDRSVFDALAYCLLCKEKVFKGFQCAIDEHLRITDGYDILFYIPIEFPIEADENRSANADYQQEIDNLIKNWLLEKYKDKYKKLVTLTGSLEDRIKQVLNELIL